VDLFDTKDQDKEESKSTDKDQKPAGFPTSLFLDFVEKNIVLREKVLNRSLRDKVEKSYIIAYQHSDFDAIKEYTTSLDKLSILNLSEKIPEFKPQVTEEEKKQESSRKMAEDTSKRISQIRKDKLKNLKVKQGTDNPTIKEIKEVSSDVEKTKNAKNKITKAIESRNLSLDKIRRHADSALDKQTEKLKDKIRKNLEAMRMSNDQPSRAQTGDISKSMKRNTTPMKTRNNSTFDKGKRSLKTSIKVKREGMTPERQSTPVANKKSASSKDVNINADQKKESKK